MLEILAVFKAKQEAADRLILLNFKSVIQLAIAHLLFARAKWF